MIQPPAGARIYLFAGVTDMRKGLPGLAVLVREALGKAPYSGDVFVFAAPGAPARDDRARRARRLR